MNKLRRANQVIREVCETMGEPVDKVLSRLEWHRLTEIRQVICYILVRKIGYSFLFAAIVTKRGSVETVRAATYKAERRMEVDRPFAAMVNKIYSKVV